MLAESEEGRAPTRPSSAHSPAFRVRAATAADAEGVALLFAQCVGGSVEEHRHGFLHEITNAGAENLVLLAEAKGEIIGMARARHFEHTAVPSESTAPEGWYLLGVNVAPAHRRRGVGAELTRMRLQWIAKRAGEAFYFTQEENHASIALHASFGFQQVTRGVEYPRAAGASGDRVLYRAQV